jgi:hypothetical protein
MHFYYMIQKYSFESVSTIIERIKPSFCIGWYQIDVKIYNFLYRIKVKIVSNNLFGFNICVPSSSSLKLQPITFHFHAGNIRATYLHYLCNWPSCTNLQQDCRWKLRQPKFKSNVRQEGEFNFIIKNEVFICTYPICLKAFLLSPLAYPNW